MKKMILVLMTLVLSNAAFADEGLKYFCKAEPKSYPDERLSVVLTQLGNQRMEEGQFTAFKLEIFESGARQPKISTKVFAITEDVMFHFNNRAEKISGILYLDELNESGLTLNGHSYDMDCH